MNIVRTISGIVATAFLAMPLFGGPSDEQTQKAPVESLSIEFTHLGICLYDRFTFDSEGEMFSICDNESVELVPPGAVLTCIRRTYSVGYYSFGATIFEDDEASTVPKIFFVLKPDGTITYHLPRPDGNFFGAKILGRVSFTAALDLKKLEHAEQDVPPKSDRAGG